MYRVVTFNSKEGQLLISEGGQTRERTTAGLFPNSEYGTEEQSVHAIGPGVYFITTYHISDYGKSRYGISTERVDYRFLPANHGEVMDQHPDDPYVFLFRMKHERYPKKQTLTIGRVSYDSGGAYLEVLDKILVRGQDRYWFAPGPIGLENVTSDYDNALDDKTRTGQGFSYDYGGKLHRFRYEDKTIERLGPHPAYLKTGREALQSYPVGYHGAIGHEDDWMGTWIFMPFGRSSDQLTDLIKLPNRASLVEDLVRESLPIMRSRLAAAVGDNLSRYILTVY